MAVTPGDTPLTPPAPALAAAGIAELVKAAHLLLDRLCGEEAKRLLDALGDQLRPPDGSSPGIHPPYG